MPHPPLIINVSTLVQGTIETTGGEEPVFLCNLSLNLKFSSKNGLFKKTLIKNKKKENKRKCCLWGRGVHGGNKAFDFLLQVLICNLDVVGFFFNYLYPILGLIFLK